MVYYCHKYQEWLEEEKSAEREEQKIDIGCEYDCNKCTDYEKIDLNAE